MPKGLPRGPDLQLVHLDPRVQTPPGNDASRAPRVGSLRIARAADIDPEPVNWVWRGRLARRKLTILSGDPGKGKSQASLDTAARITTGAEWPDTGRAPQGSVVILSAEDSPSDTIVPRLMAAGADRDRVHIVEGVADREERGFSLQKDLNALAKMIKEIGDVVLVIIDPITAYLGENIDSHRTADVRAVLSRVADFAEQANVVVLAVSHPPKAPQAKAINSVTGSLAYVAAARIVLMAIDEPDSERLVILSVKNNIGPMAAGLGYWIVAHDLGNGIVSSGIEWDQEPVAVTANEALRASGAGAPGAVDEAKEFLEQFLADGPHTATEVREAAEANGIAKRTLARAKKELGVISEKGDFEGGWSWSLP